MRICLKAFSPLVMGLVLALSPSALGGGAEGLLMVVKGDIKVQSSKDGKISPAKVGMKVLPGDAITAGPDSRAKIVMSDKNVLNVSPDSKVVIEKYENDGKDKKNVELNVLYGKVRASVEQKYDGEKSKFNIKTPSAVAGVRGTDFMAGYNPGTKTAQVITFTGTVAVGTPGPGGSIQNPVFVQPGQMTSVGAGQKPEPPRAVPKEELNKMNSETKADTASNAKSDAPENKSAAKEEQKEEKKEASSDKKESDKAADKADKQEGDKKEPQQAKSDEPKKDEPKNEPAAEKKETAKSEPKQDGPKQDGPKQDGGPKQDSPKQEAGGPPRSEGGQTAAAGDTKPKSGGGDRAPASAGPGPGGNAGGPSMGGPPAMSMIGSGDLGPSVGNSINLRGPSASPTVNVPVFIPPQPITASPVKTPAQDFINNVITNTKTRVSITIK